MTFYNYHYQLRTKARQVIFYQMLGVICFCLSLVFNWFLAYSALVGGMVAVIANFCFAVKLFSHSGAANSRKIVNSFYLGECRKFVVTVLLFFLSIRYLTLAYGYFFLGYCVSHVAFWLAAALPFNRLKSQKLVEHGV